MTTEDIRLPGVHNVENYMAAIAAVEGLVPDETIAPLPGPSTAWSTASSWCVPITASGFTMIPSPQSLPHHRGPAIPLKEKVILIAGGCDKHIPFDVLGPEVVEHVKLLVLCGATAGKDPRCRGAGSRLPAGPSGNTGCDALSAGCVETARDRAVPGDVVTLSLPAPLLTSSRTSWSGARPSRPSSTPGRVTSAALAAYIDP